MLGPKLRRFFQLDRLTAPATQLAGACTAWEIPLGNGVYKTIQATPEDLIAYLNAQGLLSAYNARPSLRKAVEFRTVAEKTANPTSKPDSSTMQELDPDSMCLGTQIFVVTDPDGVQEYKVVYDSVGPLLVYVDGNFSQSSRGKVQAKIVPNPGGGGTITLTNITENVGGFHAGESFSGTVQAFGEKLLITYQAPGFTGFAIDNGGSRTILAGTSFAAGPKQVTWATSNPANVAVNSLQLWDVTAQAILASNEANDGTLTANTAAFTAVVGLSRRYRLTGQNTKGNFFTADLDIYGETQSYFGYSTNASLTGAQAVALGNAQIQGSRARTIGGVTASGGQYTYYAYDARHGDLTSVVMDGVVQVLGAFQKLGDVASTNAAGAAVTLRVYRSANTDAFVNNTLSFS